MTIEGATRARRWEVIIEELIPATLALLDGDYMDVLRARLEDIVNPSDVYLEQVALNFYTEVDGYLKRASKQNVPVVEIPVVASRLVPSGDHTMKKAVAITGVFRNKTVLSGMEPEEKKAYLLGRAKRAARLVIGKPPQKRS